MLVYVTWTRPKTEMGTCNPRAKCSAHEHLIWPASEFLLPS